MAEINIPDDACRLIHLLENANFEAFVVGGFVRDSLLGFQPKDIDITTNARPEEVMNIFQSGGVSVFPTGIKHGTVTAVIDHAPYEITTYRKDGKYSDSRRPDSVQFVGDIAQDLSRRDFTINAMAFSDKCGLVDPFGGEQDLENGIIRFVGDASTRVSEDALRVLRAVRFAARFSFIIEENSQAALNKYASSLKHIARERVGQELLGIASTLNLGWAISSQFKVMSEAIPSLKRIENYNQETPYHNLNLLEHTARVIDFCSVLSGNAAPIELKLAALFHDIGKPSVRTYGEGHIAHFYGHPKVSAEITGKTLRELAVPDSVAKKVVALVSLHDRQIILEDRSIKHFMYQLSDKFEEDDELIFNELMVLKEADTLSKAPQFRDYVMEVDKIKERAHELRLKEIPVAKRDCALSGTDVMRILHIESGPKVGEALAYLIGAIREEEVANDPVVLEKLLKEHF